MNDELIVKRGPVATGREDEISIEHSRDSSFAGRGRMHTVIFLTPEFARHLAALLTQACGSTEPGTYRVIAPWEPPHEEDPRRG